MNDDDLVRIAVVVGSTKTSISLDGLLATYLSERLGGIEGVRVWAKETVAALEKEWAAKAVGQAVGSRVRAKTGLSRAVQREAFRMLIEGGRSGAETQDAPV